MFRDLYQLELQDRVTGSFRSLISALVVVVALVQTTSYVLTQLYRVALLSIGTLLVYSAIKCSAIVTLGTVFPSCIFIHLLYTCIISYSGRGFGVIPAQRLGIQFLSFQIIFMFDMVFHKCRKWRMYTSAVPLCPSLYFTVSFF